MRGRALAVIIMIAGAATSSAQRGGQAPVRAGGNVPPPTAVGSLTIEDLELAADRIQWERWFRPSVDPRKYALNETVTSPSIDLRILTAALLNGGPAGNTYAASFRRVAVRALGRMENPRDTAQIAGMLGDVDASVRAMAARALMQCLWDATDQPEAVSLAYKALVAQLIKETDTSAKNAIYEALGGLNYGETDNITQVLQLLATPIASTPMAAGGTGALIGFESLTRRLPNLTLNPRTIQRLRELAVPRLGPAVLPEIDALRTLQNIHDGDVATIKSAAVMNCDGSSDSLCGFEFRRIGVQMLNPLDANYTEAFDHALHDAAWQVRYDALTRAGQLVATTGTCAPLIEAFDDRVEYVVRHAVELLSPACSEHDALASRLTDWAMKLGDGTYAAAWQIPETALETLLKFAPDTAHKIARNLAATHQAWQVRAAAARMAGALYDEDLALDLARHDPSAPQGFCEANVRAAALKALRAMSSKFLETAAIDALDDPDDQLVYTAALLLKDNGDQTAIQPLLDALARLSKRTAAPQRASGRATAAPSAVQATALAAARDTSRDPRLAILAALEQLARPEDGIPATLRYLLTDTDPVIAPVAARVLGRFLAKPPEYKATKLAPIQPTRGEITADHPRCGRILLDNGKQIDLEMAMTEAPIAAARFLALATDKFFDGLTFHRVEVNNFVQGGSPDANELSSGDRFMRDEISLPMLGTSDTHGRPLANGVVALVARGRDTAAGQFFMPLVGLPALNHEFTVFATFKTLTRTTPGWIDLLLDAQIVEGTRITSIREVTCQTK